MAVGAVVVRERRLLVVRRGRGVAIGSWSLPGGRVEAGETLTEAVRRELYEETGVHVAVGALCGIAERIGEHAHYVILDYWAETVATAEVVETPTAGDDADDAAWADRAALARLDLVPGLHEFLEQHGVYARM